MSDSQRRCSRRERMDPNEKTLDSWDAAVKRLRRAIKTFEQSKRSGEPWPGRGLVLCIRLNSIASRDVSWSWFRDHYAGRPEEDLLERIGGGINLKGGKIWELVL